MSDLPSTGLPDLDGVLERVLAGDNIVWQVDAIEDYAAFVAPFTERALADGRKLVYFRFARHVPLVSEGRGAEIPRPSPEIGFESFTAENETIAVAASIWRPLAPSQDQLATDGIAFLNDLQSKLYHSST